jgi:hypothetical protein
MGSRGNAVSRFPSAEIPPRRRWRFALAACALLAVAPAAAHAAAPAPPPAHAAAGIGVGVAAPPRGDDTTAERRRELDEIQRQDLAAALALLGVSVRWQEHPVDQLADWRRRVEAAQSLEAQYGIVVDWRVTPLRDLVELRMRAAKAAELSTVYGVDVDWRRYSWAEMEAMRRTMARGRRAAAPAAAPDGDDLAVPASVATGAAPPLRRAGWTAAPTGADGADAQDPDTIIEPTFAAAAPETWAVAPPPGLRSDDPDAILIPAFVAVPLPTGRTPRK